MIRRSVYYLIIYVLYIDQKMNNYHEQRLTLVTRDVSHTTKKQ